MKIIILIHINLILDLKKEEKLFFILDLLNHKQKVSRFLFYLKSKFEFIYYHF